MNNKGQLTFISIMVALMIFVSGMLFITFFELEVDVLQNSSNLDCDNVTGITDGTKISCLLSELVVPYFILIILSFVGGILTDRFMT